MAKQYSDSTVTYSSSLIQYSGGESFIYSGNLSVQIKLQSTYRGKYTGNLSVKINPQSTYLTPNYFYTGSLNIHLYFYHNFPYSGSLHFNDVLNSLIVITQELPVNDALVDAGCPNCGTLLYNNPARGTRG